MEVIWEEQRKRRQCWEGARLCLGCGHGRRCKEEVEDVLPIITNSQSEGCYFNYPQLEITGRDTAHWVPRMLGIMFQLRWTNSHPGQTVTTRSQLGTGEESDFGESDHKAAEFLFLTNREMQERGQRDNGSQPADFDTCREAVGTSVGEP